MDFFLNVNVSFSSLVDKKNVNGPLFLF